MTDDKRKKDMKLFTAAPNKKAWKVAGKESP